jgi:hypothetical protein
MPRFKTLFPLLLVPVLLVLVHGLAIATIIEPKNRCDRSWGFIDKDGKIVIAPQFDSARPFSSGWAVVKLPGLQAYNFVGRNGELLTKNGFVTASDWPIDDSPAIVRVGDLYYSPLLLTKSGRVKASPKVFTESAYSDGLLVAADSKWGYLDKRGNWKIKPIFDEARPFSEGLACVKQNGLWGFINRSGQMVIQPRSLERSDFHEGLATLVVSTGPSKIECKFGRVCRDSGRRYGFINTRGDVVIQPQFENAWIFREGLAPVQLDFLYGFVNAQGELIVQPKYSTVQQFHEGLAAVTVDGQGDLGGKLGFINREGKEVIPPHFAHPWELRAQFSGGLAPAAVEQEGEMVYGYINKSGEWAIAPAFREAEPFSEGLAGVCFAKHE